MVSRIEKIMAEHDLSHAAFANKIGMSRSNLSHIFSGRNKPSLEVILKIHTAFPQVDLEWLLTGKKAPGEVSKLASSMLSSDEHLERSQVIEHIVVFFEDGTFKIYTPQKK